VNWKNYIKWIFYGLAFFVVLTFAHSRYYSNLSNIDKIENTEINNNIIQLNDDKEEDIFNKLLWPFKSLLEGISSFDLNRCAELIKAYYNKFTIVIILMLVLIISTKPTYSSVFTTLSILTLMAFVILGFTIKGKDITNNSFHRYLTHSFFAIPLIFIMSRGIVLQSKKIVFGFINIISLICIGFMYSKGLAEEFIWTNTNHERSLVYSDNFNKVTSASFDAFLIKEVVGPHRVVFIDGTFEDGQNEEIYTQYLLQSNSVGGELKTLNGILNRAILDNVQHDYIVIFDFRDSFADKITLVGDYPESSKIALFKKSINKSYTYIPLNQ